MKKYLVFLFAIILCSGFVSCDKDNNKGESNIVGEWVESDFTYVFKANGSGCLIMDYTSIGIGVYISNYRWRKTSTMLHLTFDGSGSTSAGTQSYYYTIEGDVLSLWYDDGDFQGAYIKK